MPPEPLTAADVRDLRIALDRPTADAGELRLVLARLRAAGFIVQRSEQWRVEVARQMRTLVEAMARRAVANAVSLWQLSPEDVVLPTTAEQEAWEEAWVRSRTQDGVQ